MASGDPIRPAWRALAPRGGARGAQRGFTYLALLFVLAVIGVGLAGAGRTWSLESQRNKERQLLWIGNQFRQAIALYYEKSPGTLKRYPEKLEDLLEDRRYLSVQRYLRRIYSDPMTGTAQWGLVFAPQGGIMGVYSLSEGKPIKTAGFRTEDARFAGSRRHADWRFTYEPQPLPSAPARSSRS